MGGNSSAHLEVFTNVPGVNYSQPFVFKQVPTQQSQPAFTEPNRRVNPPSQRKKRNKPSFNPILNGFETFSDNPLFKKRKKTNI